MSLRNIALHPSNHQVSSLASEQYDVIVIGSSPVGRMLAQQVAAKKMSVVIVENELFGGDCPFWACVPSKAILRPAEVLNSARTVGGARELISDKKEVDAEAVFARRDAIVRNWDDTFILNLSLSHGASIARGVARLTGLKTVAVESSDQKNNVTLKAKHAVVLSTGSEAVIPNIPGLAESGYWTPREAVSANSVPDHLIILGAGVVGCEMATAYAGFGKKVSLVCSSDEILTRYEPQAGKMVRESLTDKGVDVHVSTTIESVQKSTSGISVSLSNGAKIEGTTLLVAAGRKPRTTDIGLESLNMAGNGAVLAVDDSMCVPAAVGEWLYAIGDMNGRAPLTHMGVYQARIAANVIMARASGKLAPGARPRDWTEYSATADNVAISQIVVTDPTVACAGLTFSAAKRLGKTVAEISTTFQFPGAWLHGDGYQGWAQWVIDTQKKTLVGATFVGREAGDLLHASTVAIVAEVPIDRLWHAVPSFPTMSEIYVRLLEASQAVV